jgi:hypothetical protein
VNACVWLPNSKKHRKWCELSCNCQMVFLNSTWWLSGVELISLFWFTVYTIQSDRIIGQTQYFT